MKRNTLDERVSVMNLKKKRLEHWQVVAIYLVVYDAVVIAASFFWGFMVPV